MAAQHIDLVLAVLTDLVNVRGSLFIKVWNCSSVICANFGCSAGDRSGPASSAPVSTVAESGVVVCSPPSKPALNRLHPVRMSFRLPRDFLPFAGLPFVHLQNTKARSRRANLQQALSSAASICRHEGRRETLSVWNGWIPIQTDQHFDFGDLAALLGGQAFIHVQIVFSAKPCRALLEMAFGASATSGCCGRQC